jgi:hypothetical protein
LILSLEWPQLLSQLCFTAICEWWPTIGTLTLLFFFCLLFILDSPRKYSKYQIDRVLYQFAKYQIFFSILYVCRILIKSNQIDQGLYYEPLWS